MRFEMRLNLPGATAPTDEEDTMHRGVSVLAALAAAWLIAALPAAARTDGPQKPHGELELSVLSGPPQYVSGGAARVRVDVPASVPLGSVEVTVNDADV